METKKMMKINKKIYENAVGYQDAYPEAVGFNIAQQPIYRNIRLESTDFLFPRMPNPIEVLQLNIRCWDLDTHMLNVKKGIEIADDLYAYVESIGGSINSENTQKLLR